MSLAPPFGASFGAGWMPYVRAGSMPYPTGGLMPYPTGGLMPYPTGGLMPYPTGGLMPYPTGGLMPYPTGGLMPYPIGGLMPYGEPGPAEMPYGRRRKATMGPRGDAPEDAQAPIHAATQSPWPWQGTDPSWTYANGSEALLAQGLRKVRSKIVRPQDPRRQEPREGLIDPKREPDSLWWWGSAHRVQAAVSQLLAWCFVAEKSVWQVVGDSVRNRHVEPLFQLHDLPPGFSYDDQIDAVLRAAVEREDRLPEILSQLDDLSPYFNAVTGLDRIQAPHTHEFMQVAWVWSTHLVMALKAEAAELRPVQRSSLVMPIIQTPAHGSLPSGHATMSKLTADLLAALLYEAPRNPGGRDAQLDLLARRIAFNRTVAGVHFPMDNLAGYRLGEQLAKALLAAANGNVAVSALSFSVKRDSELPESSRPEGAPGSKECTCSDVRVGPCAAGGILGKLWSSARSELRRERI